MQIVQVTPRGVHTAEVSGRVEVGERGRQRTHASVTVDPIPGAVYVRFNTQAAYTRGCNTGWIHHVSGPASRVAAGRWADGDAGGLGGGPDEVWACRPTTGVPVVFLVTFSGGRQKGAGHRVVYVDAGGVRLVDCGERSTGFVAGQDPRDVLTGEEMRHVLDVMTAADVGPDTVARWRAL